MYKDIISSENLLEAWKEFLKGKRAKRDVQEFQYKLADHIILLHDELKHKLYVHGGYQAFNISDPKPRNIHKAQVRDRLVHHAIYRKLYPFFDNKFIYDSYSCRKKKGTHKAILRFVRFAYIASKNNTKTLWILKCDIRKFFASVDHAVLFEILEKHDIDSDTLWLIKRVVQSFSSTQKGKGLPLGNLTSQLLVNIYMNEFDQFVKCQLKAKYYVRYADDFVILNRNKNYLMKLLSKISEFLEKELKLFLHPNKVSIKTLASGVDYLGWVHFPDHRVIRTATKKRMFRNILLKEGKEEVVWSYVGLLGHGNGKKLERKILNFTQTKK